MSIDSTLIQRCDSKCELCSSSDHLNTLTVPPKADGNADDSVMVCDTCYSQINSPETTDANHWRCLNDSMWSQVAAVQVMAWRQLKLLSNKGETWAQDLLDMLYLEEDTLAWATAMEPTADANNDRGPAYDSNGAELKAGDSVTLIKDLDVKGAGFTAKRGTAVRNISLTDNADQIEGRVNGVRIVLLTKYLKKS